MPNEQSPINLTDNGIGPKLPPPIAPETVPLTPLPGDSELFTGREEEIAQIMEAVKEGKSILIHGVERSGKSSLLNRIEAIIPQVLPEIYVSQRWETMTYAIYKDTEKAVAGILRRKPIPVSCRKIVMLIDEAGDVEKLIKIGNLPQAVAEVTGISEENIMVIMAGLTNLAQVKGDLMNQRQKNPPARQKQIDHLLSWLPEEELNLEPAIPNLLDKVWGLDGK